LVDDGVGTEDDGEEEQEAARPARVVTAASVSATRDRIFMLLT
jgi:hypothetical protein